jgi:hypothetical protein
VEILKLEQKKKLSARVAGEKKLLTSNEEEIIQEQQSKQHLFRFAVF